MPRTAEELAELEFMMEQDNLPDDVFIARVNSAPDMGGTLLVELAKFYDSFEKERVAA